MGVNGKAMLYLFTAETMPVTHTTQHTIYGITMNEMGNDMEGRAHGLMLSNIPA
jgi:hypothetical protein